MQNNTGSTMYAPRRTADRAQESEIGFQNKTVPQDRYLGK